jgi:hypothetical protein
VSRAFAEYSLADGPAHGELAGSQSNDVVARAGTGRARFR